MLLWLGLGFALVSLGFVFGSLYGNHLVSLLRETPSQFGERLREVQDYMNSEAFVVKGGRGLLGLSKSMLGRCKDVRGRGGERK